MEFETYTLSDDSVSLRSIEYCKGIFGHFTETKAGLTKKCYLTIIHISPAIAYF